MKIAIGSDDVGVFLKKRLIKELEAMEGFEAADFGPEDDSPMWYADVAYAACCAVRNGECDRGILVCGTGIGMCMAANKVRGIRAALCGDTFSAERAALSNDAHVITLGSRVTGEELAVRIMKTWLENEFKGGRSADKIAHMMEYEDLEFKALSEIKSYKEEKR